jgi:hypothetical protein
VGNVIQGYVPEGTLVETEGYLAHQDGQAFLTPNLPSAMWPLLVDTSALPADLERQVRDTCASRQFGQGGCCAVLRGEVRTINDRRGLAARVAEVRPLPASLNCSD